MWKAAVALVLLLAVLCCGGGAGAGGWWWWSHRAVGTGTDAPVDAEVEADAVQVDHVATGKVAYEAGDYETALGEFDGVVSADPKNANALSWRGRTYAQLGLLDRAEPDLDDAARRLATDVETWRSLGWVRAKAGNDEGAARAYDEAIRLSTSDAKLYVERANANFRLGNRVRALDDASHACDLGDAAGCILRDRIHSVSGH